MKLTEAFNEKPSGKGCIPKTQKQADAWAYYDSITKAWRFPNALKQSAIEKFCILFTGQPRGIPLEMWLDIIHKMNETPDMPSPYGYLRVALMRRIKGQRDSETP